MKTDKEIVLEKYPLAETYRRISNGVWQLWESYGQKVSPTQLPLMEGDSEEEVWKKMAAIVYWKLANKDRFAKQITQQIKKDGL